METYEPNLIVTHRARFIASTNRTLEFEVVCHLSVMQVFCKGIACIDKPVRNLLSNGWFGDRNVGIFDLLACEGRQTMARTYVACPAVIAGTELALEYIVYLHVVSLLTALECGRFRRNSQTPHRSSHILLGNQYSARASKLEVR